MRLPTKRLEILVLRFRGSAVKTGSRGSKREREAETPSPEGNRAPPGEGRPDGTNLFIHPQALFGMLMGVSKTMYGWAWSGHPELAGAPLGTGH